MKQEGVTRDGAPWVVEAEGDFRVMYCAFCNGPLGIITTNIYPKVTTLQINISQLDLTQPSAKLASRCSFCGLHQDLPIRG